MKIESFPRKLFLFRNNLCMFAQTQNELHNMKHMSILAVSLLALVACTPEKKQEADYSQYVNPMIGTVLPAIPTREPKFLLVWYN